VGISAARNFADAVGGLMDRADDGAVGVDRQAIEGVGNADAFQVAGFVEERVGLNEHEAREHRAHAGDERAAAELGEAVMCAVGGDDIVTGLWSAVEADDGVGVLVACKEIDNRAFA
jgi:hypothetical protein